MLEGFERLVSVDWSPLATGIDNFSPKFFTQLKSCCKIGLKVKNVD